MKRRHDGKRLTLVAWLNNLKEQTVMCILIWKLGISLCSYTAGVIACILYLRVFNEVLMFGLSCITCPPLWQTFVKGPSVQVYCDIPEYVVLSSRF